MRRSVLVCFLIAAVGRSGEDPSCRIEELQEKIGTRVMEDSFWATKLEGCEMLATLKIYNSRGQCRERRLTSITKLYDNGKTEKSLLRFLAPPDVKGVGLLTYDYERKTDDVWFFLPAVRKTRRIVAAEKADRFMGSEFSYADMTPPPVDDFVHRLLEEVVVRGEPCYVIESVPRSEATGSENGYSKKISYIAKKDMVVRKAVYYDLAKKLHKQLEVFEVKEIDTTKHRFRALHMAMENKQNRRRSELKIHKIQLRTATPDHYFTTPYLERQ